jgi:phage N-6-adenine-methyltransferase
VNALSPRDRTATRQDYRTPQDLRHAVEKRFGLISLDLAAADGDEIVPLGKHYTPEEDSLKQDWLESIRTGVAWLNPPFRVIAPFALKCARWAIEAQHAGRVGPVICMLVPASIGSLWWASHVQKHAVVYALAPRITFHGEKDPFTKDCAICVYDPRHWPASTNVDLWRWK